MVRAGRMIRAKGVGLIEVTSERGRRLAGLSQRLRVLHAQMAEQPDDMRAEQLRDAVQREVSALPPNDREGFLKDLLTQFPTWATAGGGSAPAAPRVVAPSEPKDPRSIAERLIEACKGLSEGDRSAIAARLSAAGLVLKEIVHVAAKDPAHREPTPREPAPAPAASLTPVSPGAAATEFRKAVGLGADATLDQARTLEVAAMMAEFTLKLEPWACTYWRDVAPDAKNSVYQSLNKDLAKYVSGDEKTTKAQVANNMYNLRSLISLLMKGVVEASKQFARDHLQRFSVDEIRKAAGPGSLMTSEGIKCWQQYMKQMEGVDAPSIEKRLKALLAKDVDAGLSQVIKK